MLGSIQVLPEIDLVTGTFAPIELMTGAALAVFAMFAVFAFRQAGQGGLIGGMWRGALVLIGVIATWALIGRSLTIEQAAERRAIEARAAELTLRAIAPGSALACLDAVASAPVESACKRLLFASPEAVAAALAYVESRFTQLAASIALAERNPSAQPSLARLRRGIEDDRFGLVAHVLKTRGCNAPDCADLKLLRETSHIVANMKSGTFEAHVREHADAWQSSGAAVAAAPLQPLTATSALPAASATPSTSSAAIPFKYDFPSANSIPAVSIMNAEPGAPPTSEPRSAEAPPKRSSVLPVRRQTTREPAPAASPPMTLAPQTAAPAPPPTPGAR